MSLTSVHAALEHKDREESSLFEGHEQRVWAREHRQFLNFRKGVAIYRVFQASGDRIDCLGKCLLTSSSLYTLT